MYVMSYGVLRFAVEFFRGDYETYYFGVLTIGHFVAITMIVLAAAAMLLMRKPVEAHAT